MNILRSFIRPAVLLAAVTITSAGCDNGDETPPVQIFFGTNNLAPCHSFRVDLDLAVADAVLARLDDGSVDCSLDALLAQHGCRITFDEVDHGSMLQVTIENCDLENATLFDCFFSKADTQRLNASTQAHCSCSIEPVCYLNGPTCYPDPGICVTEDPSGWGCEDCYNHVDDDGDGDADCRDGNCWLECGVGQTTITCSTTITVTSTTMAPTTTIGAGLLSTVSPSRPD